MRVKDYRAHPNMIKLVGMRQLDELESTAEALPALACPFCGGDPEVQLAITYGEYISVYVTCSSCGIRTARLLEGRTITGNDYSLQDRLLEAVQLWSRRV